MTKQKQEEKNLQLIQKLADYIADNPKMLKKYSNSSYVVFSYKDQDLNELNKELLSELKEEGKNVIKAQETNQLKQPWKFYRVG